MLRRQTTRPSIWTLCPPRQHSFFEAIFSPSSNASGFSVRQATSIFKQWDSVMSIMAADILALQTRYQAMNDDPKATCTVSNPIANHLL
ncbi:hypothetical protein TNCV_2989831 [Trichonephila clavipes]|nr:hypothetical protein TNCV_2989831 [Trichonephila clavipes]